jgi:hypothetical protein
MNLAELILWAKNPKPFDDRTYVGENITIADIKVAFNEERDRLLHAIGNFTGEALRELSALEAERDRLRELTGLRDVSADGATARAKRHAAVLLSKTHDLLVELGKQGTQRELLEQAIELAHDIQSVLTGDRQTYD